MDHVKDILLGALELPEAERDAFLDARCAGEPGLRERVEVLLAAHAGAGRLMGAPTLGAPASVPDAAVGAAVGVGASIGPYRIGMLLGEGGFGSVYLAHQTEPVRRTVAIKILRAGIASPAVVTRLEAERQALAMMDHAGIARMYDAGQTDAGRPYFVMEHVRGVPITSFCERAGSSLRERLELFEQVCQAVQHAHHKGIIHRDIKPSNVLVSVVDGVPAPKVIDFGIAKIADPSRPGAGPTREGEMLGTPAYMSPEQVEGRAGMDTRSDVYGLGVLLYELLTASVPFAVDEVGNLAGLARIICEQEPAKPSTRAARAGAPERAARLRGDLDWIVMRAIDKDPDRRYPSADALAADVRRHLDCEPVDAGPPSAWYRFGKFAARHRGEVGAGAAAAVLLVALLVSSVVFAARVARERAHAVVELEKSRAFGSFASAMLSGVDPAVASGEDTTLFRRILDDAAARVERETPGSAEVEVEVRELIGTGFFKIGAFEDAARQYRSAIPVAERVFGPESGRTLRLREWLGTALLEGTRIDEAEGVLADVFEARTRLLGPEHADTLSARFHLALVARHRGDLSRARAELDDVVRLRELVLGSEHAATMSARNSLAMALDDLGEHERSIELLRGVIAFQLRELGPGHPNTLATQSNLAETYLELGRAEEAIGLMETVLASKRRLLDPDHPSLLVSLNNLASAYRRVGRADLAEPMLSQALDVSRANYGASDRRTLVLTNNLAASYVRAGRAAEARELLVESFPRCEASLGVEHPLTLAMLSFIAGSSLEIGAHEEAAAYAEELVVRADRALPGGHAQLASHRRLLAKALLGQGQAALAEAVLLEAFEIDGAGRSDAGREKTAALLAEACAALSRGADAARWRAWAPVSDP